MNRRLMMAQQAKKRLPADYTELQYITSDGWQWFDTGVYADGFTGARYKFSKTSQDSYDGYILSGSGFPAFPFLRLFSKGMTVKRDAEINIPFTYNFNTPYEIFVDKLGNIYIDDVLITSIGNVTIANENKNTIVFCNYYESKSYALGLKGQIYYCQIFQSGKTVRDFVPCKNPEGVVGMYDLIEGVFYKSEHWAGFKAGDEV